ncbi:MAG: cell envelope integrity protein TolA [Elusimicrobiota bacterium]
MNKLLYGLVGAGAAFLIVALVISKTAPKPDPGQPVVKKDPVADASPPPESGQLAVPQYGTIEELLADYDNAVKPLFAVDELNNLLARYSACASFKAGTDAACEAIDRRLKQDQQMTCMEYRLAGMRYWEQVQGGGAVEHCARHERRMQAKHKIKASEEDILGTCRDEAPYMASGDLDGFCRELIGHGGADGHNEGGLRDVAHCKQVYALMAGDPGRCSQEEPEQRHLCKDAARLLQALRAKNPHIVQDTLYAPLADREASCDTLGRTALEYYRTNSAQYAESQNRWMQDQRFAQQEKLRAERERAAAALAAREELEKLSKAEAEKAAKRKEEDEKAIREAKEKAEREQKEKFEASRHKDEAERSEKKLKMRDKVEPTKYKRDQGPSQP